MNTSVTEASKDLTTKGQGKVWMWVVISVTILILAFGLLATRKTRVKALHGDKILITVDEYAIITTNPEKEWLDCGIIGGNLKYTITDENGTEHHLPNPKGPPAIHGSILRFSLDPGQHVQSAFVRVKRIRL